MYTGVQQVHPQMLWSTFNTTPSWCTPHHSRRSCVRIAHTSHQAYKPRPAGVSDVYRRIGGLVYGRQLQPLRTQSPTTTWQEPELAACGSNATVHNCNYQLQLPQATQRCAKEHTAVQAGSALLQVKVHKPLRARSGTSNWRCGPLSLLLAVNLAATSTAGCIISNAPSSGAAAWPLVSVMTTYSTPDGHKSAHKWQ